MRFAYLTSRRPRVGPAILGAMGVASLVLILEPGCGSPIYSRTGAAPGSGGSGLGNPSASGGTGVVGSGGRGIATGGAGGDTTGSGGRGTGTGGAATATGGAGGRGTGGNATGGAATGGSGAGGGGTGGRGSGGNGTGGLASGGAGTGGVPGDTAHYNFEAGVQGWMGAPDAGLTPVTTVTTSAAQHFAGATSLAGTLALPAGGTSALVVLPPTPPIPAGATVTFHIFVPTGSLVDWVQPYVQEVGPSFTFTPPAGGAQLFTAGTWNTYTLVVPTASVTIGTLGVQFHASVAWTGTVYVDSINY